MLEPMQDIFDCSRLLILDFDDIPVDTPSDENIEQFFADCAAKGIDPKKPENRQRFNNNLLSKTGVRYLVSRYAEDRTCMLAGSEIERQGRTIHLGIDVFSKDTEPVFAPCDGTIVTSGHEPENHSFGYFLIIKPVEQSLPYIFLGHLGSHLPVAGALVMAGQQIGTLGDYTHHENGGWSRHLHVQMLQDLPSGGTAPLGYTTPENMETALRHFPDPMPFFPQWRINL